MLLSRWCEGRIRWHFFYGKPDVLGKKQELIHTGLEVQVKTMGVTTFRRP